MKKEKEVDNGRPLATLLTAKMRRDGYSVSALAARLGISQSYMSQLLAGEKPFTSANDAFIRNCADYIDQPVVIGFLLCGKLKMRDFFETPKEFPERLDDALKIVSKSAFAAEAAVDLDQLRALSTSVQMLIVLTFENATGDELIAGRATRGTLGAAGQSRMPFEVRVNTSR